MIKNLNSQEIDNAINTKNLIEYIESSINDEMLMKNFFNNIEIKKVNNEEIFIKTENEIISDFIKKNYFHVIKEGVKQIYSKDLNVIYLKKSQKDYNLIIDQESKKIDNFLNEKYKFDNYVECDFNKDAIRAAKNVIEQEEVMFNPIFIHSNSGLGKTHLLHALGNEISKKTKKTAVYINPDNITQKIVDLLQKGKTSDLNKLKDFYKSADVLLFDDIQNFKNRDGVLKIIFDIVNHGIEQEKQIVICSDKKPNELGGFEQRLITRFGTGLTLGIKKASFEDMKSILKFMVIDKKMSPKKWEEESYDFIAKNLSNSIRDLIGALNKIKFISNTFAKNTTYSYIVLKNIFSDIKLNKDNINEDRIILIVSKYYKISRSDLVSKTRVKNIVLARDIAMWLIRNILSLTFERIGEIFNNRTHSAVITSINRINDKLTKNISLKNAIDDLENKINKIE